MKQGQEPKAQPTRRRKRSREQQNTTRDDLRESRQRLLGAQSAVAKSSAGLGARGEGGPQLSADAPPPPAGDDAKNVAPAGTEAESDSRVTAGEMREWMMNVTSRLTKVGQDTALVDQRLSSFEELLTSVEEEAASVLKRVASVRSDVMKLLERAPLEVSPDVFAKQYEHYVVREGPPRVAKDHDIRYAAGGTFTYMYHDPTRKWLAVTAAHCTFCFQPALYTVVRIPEPLAKLGVEEVCFPKELLDEDPKVHGQPRYDLVVFILNSPPPDPSETSLLHSKCAPQYEECDLGALPGRHVGGMSARRVVAGGPVTVQEQQGIAMFTARDGEAGDSGAVLVNRDGTALGVYHWRVQTQPALWPRDVLVPFVRLDQLERFKPADVQGRLMVHNYDATMESTPPLAKNTLTLKRCGAEEECRGLVLSVFVPYARYCCEQEAAPQ